MKALEFWSDLDVRSDLNVTTTFFYPLLHSATVQNQKRLASSDRSSAKVKNLFLTCVFLQGCCSHTCTLLCIAVLPGLMKVHECDPETSFRSKASNALHHSIGIKSCWRCCSS